MSSHILSDKEFENLFNDRFDDLMGFVCSYVHDEEVARDIVHDVFMAIWKYRTRLDSSYSLKSYLFTLAKNFSLSYIRHRKVEMNYEEGVIRTQEEIQEDLDNYDEAIGRLKVKLNELPDKQREVLVKCIAEGKMYKEVADELNISLNTVKTHLKRAMKFMRDGMHEDLFILLFIAYNNIPLKMRNTLLTYFVFLI